MSYNGIVPWRYVWTRIVTYKSQISTYPLGVKVRYSTSTSGTAGTSSYPIVKPYLNLTPNSNYKVIEGTVRFKLGGEIYIDRDGDLIKNLDIFTGIGTNAGTVDYTTGIALIEGAASGALAEFELQSCLLAVDEQYITAATFAAPGAPLRTSSVSLQCTDIDSNTLTATSDQTGEISGTNVYGTVDYTTGIMDVIFAEVVTKAGNEGEDWYDADNVLPNGTDVLKPIPIVASSLKFNVVVFTYIPLDADLIGINPIRLPSDGRVPFLRDGDVVVVHFSGIENAQNPASGDDVIDTGQARLAKATVLDSLNAEVSDTLYVVDLDAGTVTLNTGADFSAYTEPLRVEWRIEDMALLSDVQINGDLEITKPLTHDFPANDTKVSSALLIGDMRARYTNLFDQLTWTGEFSDELIGDPALPSYNDVAYPLAVTNQGTVQERWALVFTSATTFNIIGEYVGLIGTGNITTTTNPNNPNTGTPYFIMDPLGWGTGWSVNNVLRFNTVAANYPIWAARTVLQGDATALSDSFTMQVRGDVKNE